MCRLQDRVSLWSMVVCLALHVVIFCNEAILLVSCLPLHVSTSLTYPVALEAILTAKVGLFSDLLASRTLQTASIFVAVCALALALLVDCHLFRWRLIHDCGALR
jgi:hypothetical protein